MTKPKRNSNRYISRAINQLFHSHVNRCWKFRAQFPGSRRLADSTPLKLLGMSYEQAAQRVARSVGVRLVDYSEGWYFVLKRTPQSFKEPAQALHWTNLGVLIRNPANMANNQNAVIRRDVLEWLLMLRDESYLRNQPGCSETLRNIDKLARLTLKLANRHHITTTLVLGLRLLGFRLLKGAYFDGLSLDFNPLNPVDNPILAMPNSPLPKPNKKD